MTTEFEKSLDWEVFESSRELLAGDVLRLRTGEVVLVGDVNMLLGVCDDCRDFRKTDIESIASIWPLLKVQP